MFIFYLIIVSIITYIEIKAVLKIKQLKKSCNYNIIDNTKVYYSQISTAPFTFFNSIIWNTNIDIHSENGMYILKHEIAHINAKHIYDKLFIQLICNIFWLNPIFWLIKRELSLIHEYSADKKSIENNKTEIFSTSLLYSMYPNNYLDFTNHFFQSPIKRRLIMLSTNTKIRFTFLRQLMAVIIVAATLGLFTVKIEAKPILETDYLTLPLPEPQHLITDSITINQTKIEKNDNKVTPFTEAINKPLFNNQSAHAFIKWVVKQISYPKEAVSKKIEGTVYLSFVIEKDGSITNIKTIRSIDPSLDNEAIRIVKSSPKWTPGKDENGNTIRVSYQIPIKFQLTKGEEVSKIQASLNKNDEIPYSMVSHKPLFNNNDANKFPAWVQKQIKYPEEAFSKKIQGTVYLSFVIEKDGSIDNIKVLRSIHPILDEEVIRVVKLSPKWTPGKDENGNTIRVTYMFPVKFELKKDKTMSDIIDSLMKQQIWNGT